MTLDIISGLQRMNDELTYPVILKIGFKRTNLKNIKNVQMKRVDFFFLRRSSRELTDICNSE